MAQRLSWGDYHYLLKFTLMTAPSSLFPLIKTKLLVPEIRPGFVHRSRLTAILDEGMLHPLTLISAPAGFGKTTLLAEWASQRRMPLAWLTLDPEDNDVLRFLAYLTESLRSLHPQVGQETLSLVLNTRPETLEAGLTFLINDLSAAEKEFILVLDEFHYIEETSIHRSLRFLLDHLPPALNLMIATRSDLPFPYTRLRAKGDLVEVREDDLRFTKAEISEFLKSTMHLEITQRELEILEERTEGWITGLQLAALSLRNQHDVPGLLSRVSKNNQLVTEFLLKEVFHQQPQEVQQFLLWTSILDTLSAPLCDAVLKDEAEPSSFILHAKRSSSILEHLERSNLFLTPLNDQREWFRYHHIFSDFLQRQLGATQREAIPGLHRRASEWYAAYGDQEAAIKHALMAGDSERAADLIENNFDRLFQVGGMIILASWIRNLMVEIGEHIRIEARPRLCLAIAWSYLFTLDLDRAEYWVEAAAAQVEKHIVPGAVSDEHAGAEAQNRRELLGQVAACRALLDTFRGNSQLTLKDLHDALDYLPEEGTFWRGFVAFDQAVLHFLDGNAFLAAQALREAIQIASQTGNLFLQIITTCQLGELQVMQGHLSRAFSTYQQVVSIAKDPHGTPLPLAGMVYIDQGEILRERNQFSDAETLLDRGIKLSRSWMPTSAIDGYVSLARLRSSLGDRAGAQQLLEEAAHLAESTEASDWDDLLVALHTARLLLQQNDLPSTTRYARLHGLLDDQNQVVFGDRPGYLIEQLNILQARFWLALGSQEGQKADISTLYLTRAVEQLQSLRSQVEAGQRFGVLIEILVLLALAEQGQGNLPEAYEALQQAFILAEPEGYLRIFVDESEPVRLLILDFRLSIEKNHGSQQLMEYADNLLAAFPVDQLETTKDRLQSVPKPKSQIHDLQPPERSSGEMIEPLTQREQDVLRLIAAGHSNQEIAAQLCIELNTVKRHASNIYGKLGVKKRTQAVTMARQLGILP